MQIPCSEPLIATSKIGWVQSAKLCASGKAEYVFVDHNSTIFSAVKNKHLTVLESGLISAPYNLRKYPITADIKRGLPTIPTIGEMAPADSLIDGTLAIAAVGKLRNPLIININ